MAYDANGNWINDAPAGVPPGANGAPPMGPAGGPSMGAPPDNSNLMSTGLPAGWKQTMPAGTVSTGTGGYSGPQVGWGGQPIGPQPGNSMSGIGGGPPNSNAQAIQQSQLSQLSQMPRYTPMQAGESGVGSVSSGNIFQPQNQGQWQQMQQLQNKQFSGMGGPSSGQFGPPQQFGMQNRMGMGGSGSPWGSAIQGAMQGMQRAQQPMGSMQGYGGNPAQQQQSNIMQGARALGGGLGQFMQQRRANNTSVGAGPTPSGTLGSQMTPSAPTPPPVSAPPANNGAAAGPVNPTGIGDMPTMAAGGVALGPGEPAQVGGLPGTTYSEPGSTMRRYAPVGPISPKVQMSPKPEEMGHHLPTKLRIGKRINVKLPRPSSKGLGGVSAK